MVNKHPNSSLLFQSIYLLLYLMKHVFNKDHENSITAKIWVDSINEIIN